MKNGYMVKCTFCYHEWGICESYDKEFDGLVTLTCPACKHEYTKIVARDLYSRRLLYTKSKKPLGILFFSTGIIGVNVLAIASLYDANMLMLAAFQNVNPFFILLPIYLYKVISVFVGVGLLALRAFAQRILICIACCAIVLAAAQGIIAVCSIMEMSANEIDTQFNTIVVQENQSREVTVVVNAIKLYYKPFSYGIIVCVFAINLLFNVLMVRYFRRKQIRLLYGSKTT